VNLKTFNTTVRSNVFIIFFALLSLGSIKMEITIGSRAIKLVRLDNRDQTETETETKIKGIGW